MCFPQCFYLKCASAECEKFQPERKETQSSNLKQKHPSVDEYNRNVCPETDKELDSFVAGDFKQILFILFYNLHENFVQCYHSGYLLFNKYDAVVDFTAYILDL